jgi:hypothetical protein
MAGGRVSVDSETNLYKSALSILTPISSDEYWRNYGLDSNTLNRLPFNKLVELLSDLSPDVSRAIWDFQRFCNPGWGVKVFKPNSETVEKKGQAAVDGFLSSLHGVYDSLNNVPADIVIGTLFLSGFLRGGLLAELVLNKDGRLPLDLAVVDPTTMRFRLVEEDERGQVYEMGQWQNGRFVKFDRETICYIPIDPLPGKPQGRPMVAPAIFCAIFLIGLLHDLRRVVAQQGYPRIDLSIDVEKLKQLMPANIVGNSVEVEAWFTATFNQINNLYADLQPDDAYVHFDAVTVNKPVGAVDADSLGGIDGLIKGLERMSVRALKSMPLLFATTDGVSEANANRQWEIHVAGIKSIQHLTETLLEKMLTIALRVQGINARVEFRFAELRAAELLRDAQVQRLNLDNASLAYDRGYVSQDEAAMMALRKPKADVPAPRKVATNPAINTGDANAVDPGSNRNKRSIESQTLLFTADNQPTETEQDAAVDWYRANAPSEARDLIEPEVVM